MKLVSSRRIRGLVMGIEDVLIFSFPELRKPLCHVKSVFVPRVMLISKKFPSVGRSEGYCAAGRRD